MELEAGDDWMARLWKTYQTTRLVFIDLRDITPNVRKEVEMTLETMDHRRCVFLHGEERTEAEWRELMAKVVGSNAASSQTEHLDVSPQHLRSRQTEADLKEILKRLPMDVPGQQEGKQEFLFDHVSEEVLKKSGRTSPMTMISIVVALALSAGFGFVGNFVSSLPDILVIVLFVLIAVGLGFTLVVLVSGIYRAAVRARRLKRAGHGQAAVRAGVLLSLAILFILAVPIFSAVHFVTRIEPLRNAANESAAVGALRAIVTAELTYNANYSEIGYACTLSALGGKPGEATPEAAQIIDEHLSSGKKSGYRFTISDCKKGVVDGRSVYTNYRVTAVPDSGAGSGAKGFCTDENGVISFDPNGGNNCKEIVQ